MLPTVGSSFVHSGVLVAMADYGKELSAVASYFNVKCGQISFTGNEKVLWLLPVN